MSEESGFRRAVSKFPGAHALSGGTDRLVAAQQDRLAAQDQTLADHERRLEELTVAVNALQGHLPEILNIIASQHGKERAARRQSENLQSQIDGLWAKLADPQQGLDHQVSELWERLEFVRREVMFELRAAERELAPNPAGSARVEERDVRVINADSIEHPADGSLRVNLGCGHVALDGYVNIDMRELPGVDVVAPVDELPLEQESLDELFSAHLVEHFPMETMRRKLLPFWVGLLKHGGRLRAVVPDAGAMIRRYSEGEMPYEQFREVFFGGQEYEGDFHFNMYTTDLLANLFREAGLCDVTVEAEDRLNGLCREFQISGTRCR